MARSTVLSKVVQKCLRKSNCYLLHGRADRGQHLECLAHHVDLAVGLGRVVLVVDSPCLAWLGLIVVDRLGLGVW